MRRFLIGLSLVIALLAGTGAVVAPNPYPLVVITLCGLVGAQMAAEYCPQGHQKRISMLFRRIRRRERLKRLVGTIRGR